MSGNLLHALYAERKPASAALCFADGSVLSTGDLVKHVALVASALHELGIREGDRVSFKLEKSAEVLFLAHACLQLGAIFNPMNTSYTDEELTYLHPACIVEGQDRIHDDSAFGLPPAKPARAALLFKNPLQSDILEFIVGIS